jgi:DNA-binding IclR family transcriptional regulator
MPKAVSSSDNTYSVPALEKGMRILENLAVAPEPLSVAELATQQSKSRNEIYRMVSCLETMGYLTRNTLTKRYSLSLKLFQLAGNFPPLARLRAAVGPPLDELAKAIGESCHICVLDGTSVSVVAQANGSERIRIMFEMGARFDPLETCSGKLILAELPPSAQAECLANSSVWKGLTPVKKKALKTAMTRAAQTHVWEEDSALRKGVRDIAVSFGTPDTLLATVAVPLLSGRQQRPSITSIREQLLQTAREIELKLGLSGLHHPA